ncbi:MAG: hypothetical protein AB8W37_06080 [Arsenophonus endosymbiont of Dermacentor nuttalli]
MTKQLTNQQPMLAKISNNKGLFFRRLDINNGNILAEMLNSKVKTHLNDIIIKNNEMFVPAKSI